MNAYFLTRDEIVDLTGYKNPKDQVRHLESLRVPYLTDRFGRPKVVRTSLEANSSTSRIEPMPDMVALRLLESGGGS